mmetsp:Transcript_56611/g.178946  ORF Transcript_56611/g.178946 Transcript_56611/m.178946 type:complete len:264 (-) Transcript_56611:326-1117(-)
MLMISLCAMSPWRLVTCGISSSSRRGSACGPSTRGGEEEGRGTSASQRVARPAPPPLSRHAWCTPLWKEESDPKATCTPSMGCRARGAAALAGEGPHAHDSGPGSAAPTNPKRRLECATFNVNSDTDPGGRGAAPCSPPSSPPCAAGAGAGSGFHSFLCAHTIPWPSEPVTTLARTKTLHLLCSQVPTSSMSSPVGWGACRRRFWAGVSPARRPPPRRVTGSTRSTRFPWSITGAPAFSASVRTLSPATLVAPDAQTPVPTPP